MCRRQCAEAGYIDADFATDLKLMFVATALGQYVRSADGGEDRTVLPRRLIETRE
jgi:hypothetical protein